MDRIDQNDALSSVPTSTGHSLAQTLPADILYEFYLVLSEVYPPVRVSREEGDSEVYRTKFIPWSWFATPTGGEILEPVSSFEIKEGVTVRPDKSSLGWIQLTHVCHNWRAIGLGLSHLWGKILSLFPDAADIMLARAGDAPLSFDMESIRYGFPSRLYPNYWSSFAELTRKHITRAGMLVTTYCIDINASLLLGKDMPSLKILICPSMNSPDPQSSPMHAPSLTYMLLDGFIPFTAPALRHLELTHLNGEKLGIDSLLDALRTAPLLEGLVLRWNTETCDDVIVPTGIAPVHLPKLSSMYLAAVPDLLGLYRAFDIPQTARIGFTTNYAPLWWIDEENERNIDLSTRVWLDSLIPRLDDQTIDCLRIHAWCELTVSFAQTLHPSHPYANGKPPPALLSFNSHPFEGDGPKLLDHLSRVMSCTNLSRFKTLHVEVYNTDSPKAFEHQLMDRLVYPLLSVTTLHLRWHPEHEPPFLAALRSGDETNSPGFASALETLIIYSVDTEIVHENMYMQPNPTFGMSAIECTRRRWKKIVAVLEHRAAIGLPLKYLVVKGWRSRKADSDTKVMEACARARVALVGDVIDERKLIPVRAELGDA